VSVDRPTPDEWRDSYLKAIEFRNPKWIIGKVVVQMDAWYRYKELMEEIVLKHPFVFPFYKKGSVKFDDFGSRRKGCTFIDPWGCKWTFLLDGAAGPSGRAPAERLEDVGELQAARPGGGDTPGGLAHCAVERDRGERGEGARGRRARRDQHGPRPSSSSASTT
jgi:hypothetical protein